MTQCFTRVIWKPVLPNRQGWLSLPQHFPPAHRPAVAFSSCVCPIPGREGSQAPLDCVLMFLPAYGGIYYSAAKTYICQRASRRHSFRSTGRRGEAWMRPRGPALHSPAPRVGSGERSALFTMQQASAWPPEWTSRCNIWLNFSTCRTAGWAQHRTL